MKEKIKQIIGHIWGAPGAGAKVLITGAKNEFGDLFTPAGWKCFCKTLPLIIHAIGMAIVIVAGMLFIGFVLLYYIMGVQA